jgi:aryl-alcohol dehydrogenase-like predicted oxidoreductase
VSLAWLLARPHVDSVLIGASNPEQLGDNLRAAELSLSREELARLDDLTRPQPLYPNWYEAKTKDDLTENALKH